MKGTKLSEIRERELTEAIKELTEHTERLQFAPPEVVMECARRYLFTLAKQNARKSVRHSEQYIAEKAEIRARTIAKVRLIATDMAEAIMNEWEPAVLRSSFALPGGGVVRWSDATVEQHEARASYLENLAAGSIETARLHRRAIHDIAAAAVDSLGEI